MKKLIFLCFVLSTMLISGCSTNGNKTVENQEITLTMDVGERTGTYSGEMVDGTPNGQGRFETVNQEGEKWYYEGSFVNGAFDGEGITKWESGTVRRGTYNNFIWEPDSAEMLESMNTSGIVGATETAKEFILDHPDFFPVGDITVINDFIDETISYKMLTKECNKYGDKIVKLNNIYIIQAFATYIDENQPNTKFTYMTAEDGEYNLYQLYYIGDIPELYDGDTVSAVYGVPMSSGGYETTSGGYANTIQVAICYVEK